jgi:predicted dinucleotide-binding enzyme
VAETTIGVLHPGEMGAAIGAVLRGAGHDVVWASAGRSPATARRAEAAGLDDAGNIADVSDRAAVILSVCPPHAALEVARETGLEEALLADWNESLPHLPGMSLQAARSAAAKGWRWTAEMEEIAATFAAAGLPDGFHLAAAELFRRSPRLHEPRADEATLDAVLRGIADG